MKTVKQIKNIPNARASDIVAGMRERGVLGAGRIARATDILKEMFHDPKYTVILTLAGPVVPAGLRGIITDLLRRRQVDALVSNGGNITHDIMESIGVRHLQGILQPNDVKISKAGIARVGDIYMRIDSFQRLERKVNLLLEKAITSLGENVSVAQLLETFGNQLGDKDSILSNAAYHRIPVFCPGVFDSMLGLHLWLYSQRHKLKVEFTSDMTRMSDIIFDAKKLGVIILGGGLPKHFALGASTLRGGVDAAVQITMDRPEAGSASGALLEEAISWRKAKTSSHLVTVIADFTIAFPLMISAALAKK
ncbi:MAG: deoxyhypusine synthase family protein [Candidatus Bathyarchaeia archaeon]